MDHLPGTSIEIVNSEVRRGNVRSALFDFDGTISLIREGWQEVMIPMMVDVLRDAAPHRSDDDLRAWSVDYVDRTTGVQTIYQMMGLRDEIGRLGGEPLDPAAYKRRYLDLLWDRIGNRVQALKRGQLRPEKMLLPGAIDLLENLRRRSVTCYLASGTDIDYVRDEAQSLGVHPYFNGGVYGAIDNYEDYSKARVISDILTTHGLRASSLVVFGDGFVEIENAKEVGGIAVGVASDEVHRAGVNEWKRDRLIRAGADLIVPDFREQNRLVEYLCGEDGDASLDL